jgi:aerobic carbon-monoxide dehydrogenase medium subunit
LVLEGRIRSIGPEGARETPMRDFLVAPGATRMGPADILTEIVLDPPKNGAQATFLKKTRVSMDLAQASVAVLLEMDRRDPARCTRARVAAGSVAPRPIRLPEVEQMLEGATLSPELVARASEVAKKTIAPISDLRASAEFRREIVGAYVRRAVATLLGWRRS